jgi:chromatin segregation and condensation protein Rec8/ScpA/Scc1 (kleisin family)
MPEKGFKTITIPLETYEKVEEYCKRNMIYKSEMARQVMTSRIKEYESYRKLASRITAKPETVRMYT